MHGKLDATKEKRIAELAADPKKSNKEIAAEVGCSETAVTERYPWRTWPGKRYRVTSRVRIRTNKT